jgi:hypothetical protein
MSKETDAIEARYEDQSENEGRFQKALSQCGHGYRLQIKRMKPTWCDGLCDTWELDPNEILDLETIREEIGGRTLKLVIVNETGAFQASRTIKFPDPPRKEGKTLVRQDDDGPTASAAPTKEIVAMLLDAQKSNTEILRGIMDSRLAALEARATAAPISVAPHEPRITDPMKQIRESIATIKQLEQQLQAAGMELKTRAGIEQMKQDGATKRELMKQTAAAHIEDQENQAWMEDTHVKAQVALSVAEINAFRELLRRCVR